MPTPNGADESWTMDFVADALSNGRRVRMLTIIDTWNRECPHIEVDFSLTGVRVARVLEQLRQQGRCPPLIQVDNGPEFVSKALDAWAHEHGVKLQFIRPGKPVENAYIESFNGRLREECLNQHAFVSLDDARKRIETWRTDYNSARPHSALGQLAPDQFRQLLQSKTGKPANYEWCTRRGTVIRRQVSRRILAPRALAFTHPASLPAAARFCVTKPRYGINPSGVWGSFAPS